MRLKGIGVDLLDLRKARRFLKNHSQKKLARLFTPHEWRVLKRARFSAPVFARHFCAKEAFFKTFNASWLGIEGFASMETRFKDKDHFSIQWIAGPLSRKENFPAEGVFFKTAHLIGAQVIRWEN